MYKRLFSYMKEYWLRYVLALVLMGLIVLLDILNPYFMGLSLKELGKETIDFSLVLSYFFRCLILIILLNVMQFCQTMLLHYTGQKIVYKIREEVFMHIQSFSHRQFNEIPVGTLVTRDTSDINVLFQLYTNVIVNILKNAATIIGVLVAMFLLNWKLALLVLAVLPVIGFLTVVFRIFLRRVHRDVRTEVSNMNAFLSENISGMKITQIFNQEEKKYNEFKTANERLRKKSFKETLTFGIFRPSVYLVYILTVILIMYVGGNEAIGISVFGMGVVITFSELYTFYQYISKFFNPIQMLADQFNTLQSAFAAAEKIFSILDIVPDIVDSEDAIDVELKGNIEFKNVWFSYVENEWILKDVSFKVNANECVAFVGATGAGKTTILGLITRNYDIQKGQILIDGIDIKKIKISCLRSQIGQMLQDVFLFSGTLASNIRLDEESISDSKVINACHEVNASSFINKLPDGINTKVGERGNNLSLGQRQLISFARTLVHEPKIMILDEATANIDTETEKIIQDSLEKVIKNNTMLMVAHRLSTIQHADKIIVFDHGRIIESGNHQELLKMKGRYYQLFMLQYQKQELAKITTNNLLQKS
ncbi:MAG: ABC transporter ATP-binding protein [Bacilli bacterium]|nr:ABC transporter ATP-binding protein [Bacilli bacterium]